MKKQQKKLGFYGSLTLIILGFFALLFYTFSPNNITGAVVGLIVKPVVFVIFGFFIIGIVGLFVFRNNVKR